MESLVLLLMDIVDCESNDIDIYNRKKQTTTATTTTTESKKNKKRQSNKPMSR
jgi:hypothetical protein